MKQLAENLWMLTYPLKLLGADLRRHVTVVRLNSGKLCIHSTGPFTRKDAAAISALGEPAWIVEAMISHDTFSQEGHDMFPDLPFLAPEGFSERVKFPVLPLLPPPAAWGREFQALQILGNDSYREHVFFHPESRTLIVADLAFNFGPHEPFWTELMLKAAIGNEHDPGMSRPFLATITDEAAFRRSMDEMLEWDFDRVIVGHGDVIETDGHRKIATMLEHAEL
ncbi:MAG TPA: hypothetical protein VNB29_08400 [Chthoniobacterales bacterium]|nr:hypothetical protein [Chthoniobacterales bacterium]